MGAWYTDNISLINLALLPGYAFILWLLYRGRRLFVECFVCTLYGQSALYLLLLPLLPAHAGNTLMMIATLGVAPVYNYLALRRAFDREAGVARWRTALRTLLWTVGQILIPMLFGILIAIAYLALPELLPAPAAATR